MRKRKGNIRHRISAVLMSILCLTMIVPSGVTAMAAEAPDADAGLYTVSLAQSEGGMLFFDGTEDSIAQFAEGDAVNVGLQPAEGFEFSSITLAYSDTGEIAAEGADKGVSSYTFIMPAADLTVSAEWAAVPSQEAVAGGTVTDETVTETVAEGSAAEAAYEGQAETVTEAEPVAEAEEAVEADDGLQTDAYLENYILTNLNESLTGPATGISLANGLIVKNTMFDGNAMESGDTLTSVMRGEG